MRSWLQDTTFDNISFQIFYLLLNVLSLIALGSKSPYYAIPPAILIPIAVIHFILVKRSARLVLSLQGFLILQTCVIGLLLFMNMPSIHIGHKLIAISIYCLYSASILKTLNKARAYLVQEKAEVITT